MPLPWPPAAHAADTGAFPSREPGGQWKHHDLVIWGAHGGAGTSTLAAWLRPALDLGALSPEAGPPFPAQAAAGNVLVVTCRSTAWSAAQATRAVTVASRHGGHVAVLAVLSDGWPEPATAASRFRLLEPHTGAVVRVPFVPGLRLADDPVSVPLPRRALRALAQIQAAAGRPFPFR